MYFPEKNAMYRQALSIPELLETLTDQLKEEVRFALSVEQTYSAKNVYLIGSGDSYIAAKAALQAFSRLAHMNAQALSSLEASRYVPKGWVPEPGNHNLVIAISNSGETSRVIEAVKAWKATGAMILTITANRESTLGRMSSRTVCTALEPFASAPEIRSCEANLLALYLLAIRFGENRGIITMDQANGCRREIRAIAGDIRQVSEAYASALKDIAKLCVEKNDVEFLGCGPARGAAEFGVAKVYEAVGTRALAQDCEEFCHLNFFRRDPKDIPTILMMPSKSLAMSRLKELVWLLNHIERPYFVLTDGEERQALNVISCTREMDELFAPLYYFAVLGQMVSYMNMFIDEDYYRGHLGVWDESRFHINRQSGIEEAVV